MTNVNQATALRAAADLLDQHHLPGHPYVTCLAPYPAQIAWYLTAADPEAQDIADRVLAAVPLDWTVQQRGFETVWRATTTDGTELLVTVRQSDPPPVKMAARIDAALGRQQVPA